MSHDAFPGLHDPRPSRHPLGAVRPGPSATLVLVLAALLPTREAGAGDGAREINQTCAVQTGCFTGDTAGFPVSISTSGSYRLTSNLVVPDENTDGIAVSTSDVGIDLNQFAIIRAACVGVTAACTPASGSGTGVERASASMRSLSVRNGSITGMGSYGLLLGDQAEVHGVRVRWNRFVGVLVGSGSTVTNVAATQNGSSGIATGGGSTVSGISSSQNGDAGISVGFGSAISQSAAFDNGGNGITGGVGVSCSNNSAYLNQADGIWLGTGSTIVGNSAFTNGSDGISCGNGCIVQSNAVRNNADYGLNLALDSAYRENVISGNQDGTVLGDDLVNLGNSCNGSAVCP